MSELLTIDRFADLRYQYGEAAADAASLDGTFADEEEKARLGAALDRAYAAALDRIAEAESRLAELDTWATAEIAGYRRQVEAQAEMYRRLQSKLDTIEGVITGQPGPIPSPKDHAWSPALAMVVRVMVAREEAERRLAAISDGAERAIKVVCP